MTNGAGSALYLGLISGTSMDGVDAVLAEFREGRFAGLRAVRNTDYPPELRARLLEIAGADSAVSLRELASLDAGVAVALAAAASGLLAVVGSEAAAVRAIGSHGQTIFHDTARQPWATLQIGDPSRIAARTGIDTVADFRRKDMALGGQGAPLLPVFHHALFADKAEARCVLNIGGIANLTVLPGADAAAVRGFDTGPGNGLMNEWSELHLGKPYDADGAYAASGRIDESLLAGLLAEPYFTKPAPKSTGRSEFNLAWARGRYPGLDKLAPPDVQANFAELTARSVAEQLRTESPVDAPPAGLRRRRAQRPSHGAPARPAARLRRAGHRRARPGRRMGGSRRLRLAGDAGAGRPAGQPARRHRGIRSDCTWRHFQSVKSRPSGAVRVRS